MGRVSGLRALLVGALTAACVAVATPVTAQTMTPSGGSASARTVLPLAGVRIALDPGHQLGNHNFPAKINQLVPAGGFSKPCNTTGTATNGGYAESTLNFRIANLAKTRLEDLGATVLLTRSTDSQDKWGPCVDRRGEFGKSVGAALMVSIHGDGAPSGDHGFHVIAPTRRYPWTTDISGRSLQLAKAVRAGFDTWDVPRSNYVGGGTALNIRSDLGTLNMSDVPVAMVEVGNMKDRSDAHRMTTYAGRLDYARGVVNGIRRYLGR